MKSVGKCSIIVSVFNEEEGIEQFHHVLSDAVASLQQSFEFIFVNDGSTDKSSELLLKIAQQDSRVNIINFSRNFGHEAAMIAGIDHCTGDVAICMDGDLQHPPHYISQMLQKCDEGADIVYMVRKSQEQIGTFKKYSSSLFYKLINKLSPIKLIPNASDFFLMNKSVINLLQNDYRERTRFLRGLIQSVGFNAQTIDYVAAARVAGESKYSLSKLLSLSMSAIMSFSKLPLKIGIYTGFFFVLLSIILIIYSLVMWFCQTPVSGYTTLIIFLCAFAGILLFVMGIIGYYIGYIFDEVKHRPMYIVKDIIHGENQ